MNNIEKIFNMASTKDIIEGGKWYDNARNIAKGISLAYNISLIKVSGIISALSINNSWDNNLRDIEKFLYCKEYNLPVTNFKYTTFNMSIDKASQIYEHGDSEEKILKILNGNKVKSFFLNIYRLDENSVTIDRHAISIFRGERVTKNKPFNMTNKRYRDISKAYKETAKKIGISPFRLQSVTWVTYRRLLKVL